ncbi:MAG: (d)CMP kinase [Planctomycetota bacterium]
MIIAIDGPAGSGKSSIAKMIAKHLGFTYLDTGAMYRALTWKAMQTGVNLESEDALCKLMDKTSIAFQGSGENARISVDGVDVAQEIRSPAVTNKVHHISGSAGVRRRMVTLQQKFASEGNVVAEGRDMGTVVFPGAEKKFFLDADIEERARRRFGELQATGKKVSYEGVVEDMEIRDRRDSTRSNSPLTMSPDATYIDTTKLTIEGLFNRIMREIKVAL